MSKSSHSVEFQSQQNQQSDLFSALEASESKLRMLFDHASDGIFVFDKDGRLTDVNRSGCAMVGFNRQELIGKIYDDLITPENLKRRPVQREKFLAEKTMIVQRDFQRRDGSSIVVEVSAKLMPDRGMLAVVRDITARQEQTQQLQQIIGIVPDGILLLDSERKVALANKSGESYLSRVAKYSSNGRITHLGPLSIDEIYQPFPTPSPWQEITSENEQRLYQAAVWPLNQDHPDGFLVVMLQDVTEERAIQSYQSAQERLAIVGQMAAGIAHDFNNIMAVIVLYTQLLLQMPDLPPKEEKRLVTIFEQSRRASELVHQILDFSRQSLLERKPLNLPPFLKELIHLLQRTLPENIELILDYQEGSLFINADPTRIQQSIMNLALNARDAMPRGGSLILSLKATNFSKKQNRPLPDMAPGKWLLLQVTDTGTGISAENLPHIFEPFFTTKPLGQGTGLGLAQVYGIVKQHEGFIDVRSTPGEGTTFSIYLPVFEPRPSVQPQTPIELPTSRKHETILVVEDNKNARLAVIEILEMLNYHTLSASNGSDALSIFEANKEKIDLVLSDVVMPTMDGAALHEALAQIDPAVKMIMMTGYPLDQSAKELINDNVIAWMQKPLHTEQIAQTIYQALYETNN